MPPTRPIEERFWEKVSRKDADACWEWQRSTRNGYGQIRLGQGVATEKAHRVAYMLAKGDIPKGMVVRHTCDNPPCCNPAHLILGTYSDNMTDTLVRNRKTVKLTIEQAMLIRQLHSEGYTGIALANMFNVSESLISRVLHNQRRLR